MADTTIGPLDSGFYSSQDGDRLYTAEDMGRPYTMAFADGIFRGDFLRVHAFSEDPGMAIGYTEAAAILGGKWVFTDGGGLFRIEANTSENTRIDSVILRVNTNTDARQSDLILRTGTPAADPQPPALVTSEGIYELRLANVTVAPGATAIVDADIEDLRGSEECPWVTIRAVSNDPVADGAITTEKLATGSVTSDKLATGAVTADKLANGSVQESKIAGASVTRTKLGPDVTDRIPFLSVQGTPGTYTQKASINNGAVTYYWELDT